MSDDHERKEFGPDIDFEPGNSNNPFEFWAEVSATDATGVAVNGIRAGDEIRIVDISGDCAFEGGDNNRDEAPSFIGTLADSLTKPWALAVKGLRRLIPILSGGDKRRDGYGQEPGKTDFAIKEGGVLFCFPGTGGALFSNDNTRPTIQTTGTQSWRVAPSTAPGQCHFPIRGGQNAIQSQRSGILRIVAFDHKHVDNAGVYEVVFTITRPVAGAD